MRKLGMPVPAPKAAAAAAPPPPAAEETEEEADADFEAGDEADDDDLLAVIFWPFKTCQFRCKSLFLATTLIFKWFLSITLLLHSTCKMAVTAMLTARKNLTIS